MFVWRVQGYILTGRGLGYGAKKKATPLRTYRVVLYRKWRSGRETSIKARRYRGGNLEVATEGGPWTDNGCPHRAAS